MSGAVTAVRLRDSELAERCFQIPARVDRVVHLAVIGGEEDMDDELFDWLCEDCADVLGEQFEPLTFEEVVEVYGVQRGQRRSALAEAFIHKPLLGWLVEVATPRRRDSRSFSWGVYTSRVFYGETYAAALEAGLAWAETL